MSRIVILNKTKSAPQSLLSPVLKVTKPETTLFDNSSDISPIESPSSSSSDPRALSISPLRRITSSDKKMSIKTMIISAQSDGELLEISRDPEVLSTSPLPKINQTKSVFSPLSAFGDKKLSLDYKSLSSFISDEPVTPERRKFAENSYKQSRETLENGDFALDYSSSSPIKKVGILLGLEYVVSHISELQSLVANAYSQTTTSIEGSNWKFYCDSKSIQRTFGFYGQVWVNEKTKQLVFVAAGTKTQFMSFEGSKISNLFGLMHLVKDAANDIQIFMKQIPFQYKYGMARFINKVMGSIEDDLKIDLSKYEVITTGHSLGAILADMGSLHLQNFKNEFKAIHSLTMENPGSKPAMTKLADHMKKLHCLPEDFDLESIKGDFTIVNNKPNWVNTANEQYGTVHRNEVIKFDDTPEPLMMKYMPGEIRLFFRTAQEHFEWHDNRHCEKINCLSPMPNWPVGLFSSYVDEKVSAITSALTSLIPRSSWLASLYIEAIKIAKIVESSANDAKETINEFREHFSDVLEIIIDELKEHPDVIGADEDNHFAPQSINGQYRGA